MMQKKFTFVGKTKDSSDNTVAFVQNVSAGVKEWEKTLESTDGTYYTEFERLYIDGHNIWVVGHNRPNSTLLDSYNPDVILAKYTEADNGLSAALTFQKGYAGISGSTRRDCSNCYSKVL